MKTKINNKLNQITDSYFDAVEKSDIAPNMKVAFMLFYVISFFAVMLMIGWLIAYPIRLFILPHLTDDQRFYLLAAIIFAYVIHCFYPSLKLIFKKKD